MRSFSILHCSLIGGGQYSQAVWGITALKLFHRLVGCMESHLLRFKNVISRILELLIHSSKCPNHAKIPFEGEKNPIYPKVYLSHFY